MFIYLGTNHSLRLCLNKKIRFFFSTNCSVNSRPIDAHGNTSTRSISTETLFISFFSFTKQHNSRPLMSVNRCISNVISSDHDSFDESIRQKFSISLNIGAVELFLNERNHYVQSTGFALIVFFVSSTWDLFMGQCNIWVGC